MSEMTGKGPTLTARIETGTMYALRRVRALIRRMLGRKAPRDYVAELRELLRAGDIAVALDASAKALAAHPKHKGVLAISARAALQAEAWELALERYQQLMRHASEHIRKGDYRGMLRTAQELDRADLFEEIASQATNKFPSDSGFRLQYTLGLARSEKGEAALQSAKEHIDRFGVADVRLHVQIFNELFENGFGREAYEFKNYAAKCYACETDVEKPRLRFQVAGGYAFLGDYESSADYIRKIGWDNWDPISLRVMDLLLYCELMCGRPSGEVFAQKMELERRREDSRDDALGVTSVNDAWQFDDAIEYFKDKTVAIVGPADTGQDLRSEIDGYDLVVRTNVFSYSDLLKTERMLGSRVDMSYYTDMIFEKRKDELYRFLNETQTAATFRFPKNLDAARGEARLRKVRRAFTAPHIFMPDRKNMHAIQRIAWDILSYSPKSVKVFNVNFYAGGLYMDGYNPEKKPASRRNIGIVQDPYQGFMFAKNLRRIGLVEFDPVASKILDWDGRDYVDMLDRTYAKVWAAEDRLLK